MSKFSILDHLNTDHLNDQEKDDEKEKWFNELLEEVRTELYQQVKKSDEERKEYNDELNLAVMGYEIPRRKFKARIESILEKKNLQMNFRYQNFASLADAVFAKTIGLDVIDPYVTSGEYEEVQVNGLDVYLVKDGDSFKAPVKFSSIKDVIRLQDNLVLYNEDRIDRLKPEAEVTLVDGSRVTMTRPPYTDEPSIAFRMFNVKTLSFDGLIQLETINEKMAILLRAMLFGRLTGVIIGDTNVGKTTTIKSMIYEIYKQDPAHRFATLEPEFELHLKMSFPGINAVCFKYLPEIGYTGRKAFRTVLRMTPKRVFVQEFRDDDANEFIRAATRGHDGSWGGAHISKMEYVIDAIAEMVTQDGRDVNYERLVARIAKHVIDIGIQQKFIELKDGRKVRKITRISEFDYENNEVIVRDLCVFDYYKEEWVFPNMMSKDLALKIFERDRKSFENLVKIGMAEEEWLKQ